MHATTLRAGALSQPPDMRTQFFQNYRKYEIFRNWLDTRPKMETHDSNVYPTNSGGVLQGFWSPFLNLGARSAIFWHLKTGTFGKSAHFKVPKNGISSDPIKEQSPKTSRNTPKNGWVDIWVMRFHFRASIKPIFENHVFRAVSETFYPLKRPETSKNPLRHNFDGKIPNPSAMA